MLDITIVDALPHQADELTDIAMNAKAYWGYSSEQLDLWREFLTISSDYIQEHQVWVASLDQGVARGFAAIEQTANGAVLEHLWVSPEYIGQGLGRKLFRYVASIVPEFTFTSDPHADDFYIKMGAQKIGEYESMLQGRMLTRFRYTSQSH